MLSEADSRVMVALFSRISHGKKARPFMAGWIGDEIRFSIQFSSNRPMESLTAAARLAATIGIEILVYSCDGLTSTNMDLPPSQDPEARECIMGWGWHGDETAGWSSLVSREDDGTLAFDEPHRLESVPVAMDLAIRQALGEPDSLGQLSGWLTEHQHSLHIYPS